MGVVYQMLREGARVPVGCMNLTSSVQGPVLEIVAPHVLGRMSGKKAVKY